MQPLPRQAGFTLLELMIVVAIIGVLAAIGLLAYNSYTIRAKVVEGLANVGKPQYSLFDFYASTGRWPVDNTEAGLMQPTAMGTPYVRTITVQPGGRIEIAYREEAGNGTIVFQAILNGTTTQWNCQGGTLASSYRPQMCR